MTQLEERGAGQAVRGAIDAPDGPVGPMIVRGWALGTNSPVSKVELWLDGRPLGRAGLGRPRLDLATALDDGDAELSGFELRLDAGGLDQERGILAARVTLLDGTRVDLPPVTIALAAGAGRRGGSRRARLKRARPRPRLRRPRAGPLRLLCFARSLDLGGSQLRLGELVRHLAATGGFEITVVAPGEGPLRPELEAAGAAVQVAAAPIDDISAYEDWLGRMSRWGKGRFDLVLASTLTTFPAVELAGRLALPSVWRIGEIEPLPTVVDWLGGSLDPLVALRARKAFQAASLVVFNSNSALQSHQRRGTPSRVAVLGTGTDVAGARTYARETGREDCRRRLAVAPDRRLLVCAGTRWPIKGQGVLLAALNELRADHPRLECVLIGQPTEPYAQALDRFIRRHGLGDRVRVLPFARDLRRWWRAADVAVCPSESESMPAAVLEAMAFGLPVLASRVGGVPEVVEAGSTGWLFEPRDLGSMIAGLQRVAVAEPGELRALGERAARRVVGAHDSAEALALMTGLLRQVALGRSS